eukprot:910743-Prymnesium_polylepis.1
MTVEGKMFGLTFHEQWYSIGQARGESTQHAAKAHGARRSAGCAQTRLASGARIGALPAVGPLLQVCALPLGASRGAPGQRLTVCPHRTACALCAGGRLPSRGLQGRHAAGAVRGRLRLRARHRLPLGVGQLEAARSDELAGEHRAAPCWVTSGSRADGEGCAGSGSSRRWGGARVEAVRCGGTATRYHARRQVWAALRRTEHRNTIAPDQATLPPPLYSRGADRISRARPEADELSRLPPPAAPIASAGLDPKQMSPPASLPLRRRSHRQGSTRSR